MSEFKVNTITDRTGTHGPQICGITTFGSSGMQLPNGPTEYRGGRGRGVFGSGSNPSSQKHLDMIEIATKGDAVDFGNDTIARTEGYATGASSTRGIMAAGYVSPDAIKTISYFIFSSNGGVNDFGETIGQGKPNANPDKSYAQAGASDSTRMLIAGGGGDGWQSTRNISFITMATTGDTSFFGELIRSGAGGGTPSTEGFRYFDGFASPTRAVFAGGDVATTADINIIQYVTIQTLGNAETFGELIKDRSSHTCCSNATRGLIAGGQTPSPNLNSIEFVTIASTGNSEDFGDISHTTTNGVDYLGSCASSTRGIFAGGQTPTKIKTIGYVTIASTGDSTEFGDLTVARRFCGGSSDVHGGLG